MAEKRSSTIPATNISEGGTRPRCAWRAAVAVVGGAWALMAGALFLQQDRLLYPRGGDAPSAAMSDVPAFMDAAGVRWGLIAEPEGPPNATVVFFHGNAGLAEHRFAGYAQHFTSRGYRVVFAEYPGYGPRSAMAVSKDSLVSDGVELTRAIRARFSGPLWVAGESLGAGVAAQVVQSVPVERALLITPWHRLSDVAGEAFPWLPVRWLLKADYDSCEPLKAVAARVTVILAEQDRLIPPRHAKSLSACLGLPPAQQLALPESGHNDWARHVTPAQWDALLSPSPARIRPVRGPQGRTSVRAPVRRPVLGLAGPGPKDARPAR